MAADALDRMLASPYRLGLARMDAYVARHVGRAIFATLFVFAAVSLLLSVLDELNGAVGLARATRYALLGLPRRVHELTPFVAMLGALIGLGALAANQELNGARAAGVSVYRLAAAALVPALLLAAGSQIIAETLAPWGERAAEVARASAREGVAKRAPDLARGYWYRDGDAFVAVDAVASDGSLRGMTGLRFDARGQLLELQFARRATFASHGGWLLEQVVTTQFSRAGAHPARTTVTRSATAKWPSSVTPGLLSTRVLIAPSKLSIGQLWKQVAYMQHEKLDARVYALALWRKAVQPIALIVLVLLAVSFVFGPLRDAGMGVRLTIGAFVGLAFKYLQDLAAPLGMVVGAPALLSALLPVVVTFLVAVVLLRRAA